MSKVPAKLVLFVLILMGSQIRAQHWRRPDKWDLRAARKSKVSPRMRQLMALPVNPDTNGDCLIDDEEARAAAEEDIQKLEDLLGRFTRDFDTDGDGTLGPDERKRLENDLYDRGRKPPKMLERLDANHDWRLSDEEKEKAEQHLIAVFKRRNQLVLERFDANNNGKLDDEEREKARKYLDSISFGGIGWNRGRNRKKQRIPRPNKRGGG